MNINQKIAELGAGGLPRYNRKVNEVIEAVNWLLGMRTANGSISDGGRGPIIDTGAPLAATAAQPWLTDPDGNPGGWTKYNVPDQNGNVAFQWIWASYVPGGGPFPWSKNPSGVTAQWVQHDVCVNGNVVSKWFWGTP